MNVFGKVNLIFKLPFRNNLSTNSLYLILAVIIIYSIIQISILSLRRANRILKEKEISAKEIENQKELLSLRNKDIEDSLRYAHRIQAAMLVDPKMFKSILPNSFIFHQPKDIVSGDFYWISETDTRVFIAVVDCTGHGLPGALISIIGLELFRNIIINQKINDPSEILYLLNKNFEEIFGTGAGESVLQDGMDLTLCILHKNTNLLEFAGAINSVYIVREDKLIELNGDRFSIGADSSQDVKNIKIFTSKRFQLEPNDMLYMFTDGYPDQFGGPEGKKFKYRRLRHLLLAVHDLTVDEQKDFINESINMWMAKQKQVDDMLVIGIRSQ